MDLREQIAAIFLDALGIEVPAYDTDLVEAGLIDSLILITVVLEIERQLGVSIALESVDPERLRTIDGIASLVRELRESSDAPSRAGGAHGA